MQITEREHRMYMDIESRAEFPPEWFDMKAKNIRFSGNLAHRSRQQLNTKLIIHSTVIIPATT